MNKKAYFIIAVIFSLLLPIIFSTIYFCDQYKSNEEKLELAKIDTKPEVFYVSSKVIDNLEDVAILDNNFESLVPYEFSVLYSDINNDINQYQLILSNIEFSENIDLKNFKWRLFMLDYNGDKYKELSSGNFENVDTDKMIISPRIEIKKNEIQRFKLYYYQSYEPLSNRNYVGNTFKAIVEVG